MATQVVGRIRRVVVGKLVHGNERCGDFAARALVEQGLHEKAAPSIETLVQEGNPKASESM